MESLSVCIAAYSLSRSLSLLPTFVPQLFHSEWHSPRLHASDIYILNANRLRMPSKCALTHNISFHSVAALAHSFLRYFSSSLVLHFELQPVDSMLNSFAACSAPRFALRFVHFCIGIVATCLGPQFVRIFTTLSHSNASGKRLRFACADIICDTQRSKPERKWELRCATAAGRAK